jgi:hypothetical protein
VFAVNLALAWWGRYQVSMVGTGDHHLSNTSPRRCCWPGTQLS